MRMISLAATVCIASGCPGDDGSPSNDSSSGSSTETGGISGSTGPATPGTGTDGTGTSAGLDTTAGGVDDTTGEPPLPPLPCPDEWQCKEDEDGDDTPLSCDNAPQHTNPDQGDMDYDSFGDVVDLCPTVQNLGNTADSDKDGVGNDCDLCRYVPSDYPGPNDLPARYAIRNAPSQLDSDRDGVGDACDNCPTVPNCHDYGVGPGLTPYEAGMPLDFEDAGCQPDSDANGVGDACEGQMDPGADGPRGFAAAEDFDQDGLSNAADLCPRLPAGLGTCVGNGDCPEGSACVAGTCNHRDPDGDGVGTECDTCPFASNPAQVMEGMQALDDPDGDFVGNACETHPDCEERRDPRRLGFFDVSVGGYCCTTVYRGQPLEDPDGNALDPDGLPVTEPGVLTLPPGCEAALAEAGVAEASPLDPVDVGGLDELWPHLCFMPQWDQDFDGIGDLCDLCRFAYDPSNTPYVDANGMRWPNDGAFCNGAYVCTD